MKTRRPTYHLIPITSYFPSLLLLLLLPLHLHAVPRTRTITIPIGICGNIYYGQDGWHNLHTGEYTRYIPHPLDIETDPFPDIDTFIKLITPTPAEQAEQALVRRIMADRLPPPSPPADPNLPYLYLGGFILLTIIILRIRYLLRPA